MTENNQSDLQHIWRNILGELELQISKAQFTTWFKGCYIFEIKDKLVKIATPKAYTSQWLENNYKNKIFPLLQKYSEEPVEKLIFIVAANHKRSAGFINTQNEKPMNNLNIHKRSDAPNRQNSHIYDKAQQSIIPEFGLNQRYNFENFIVGKGNELAYAAANAVADSPGLIYNPFFIYGGVGLGKTHLMQAIGIKIKAMLPQKKILYISSEKFVNDFIYSIKQNSVNEFKRKYRTIDVLLVDDIQFISGKESTQEEFFHTFNELYQNNKQIILTSDRPPKEIKALEQRLLSRFEWGMIADIRTPDLETRIAILQNKSQEKGIILDSDSVYYIAEMVPNNIRELEGVLNKLLAYQQINNMPLSFENIKMILGNAMKITSHTRNLSPESLLSIIAKYFNISKEDILSKKRNKHLVYPRQILCYLLKEQANYSYPAIGKFLNGRDHTTILHAVKKIVANLPHNQQLGQDIDALKKEL